MDWLAALKLAGAVLGALAAFAGLQVLAFWQATRGMTDEEKDRLLAYIEERGLLASLFDDDL